MIFVCRYVRNLKIVYYFDLFTFVVYDCVQCNVFKNILPIKKKKKTLKCHFHRLTKLFKLNEKNNFLLCEICIYEC